MMMATRVAADTTPYRPWIARAARASIRRFTQASQLAALVARNGWPDAVIYHGHAPGDDMLCTAVLHELRLRGSTRLWVMTNHPSLFANNPDVHAIVPHTPGLPQLGARLGWRIHNTLYGVYDPTDDRDLVTPGRHIIESMCREAQVRGTICLRPYLFLTPEERLAGKMVERQIVVQSSGMNASYPMLTKQWRPERYNAVVGALRASFNFVQIGSATDPPLEGVTDLRGRTTIRESAAILAESLVYVGNVGFLMHLARAVECRSVIIYGGREKPSQSGYSCNENLFEAIPCAPCWLRNRCPYNVECMNQISANQVISAIQQQVARFGESLHVDTVVIAGA